MDEKKIVGRENSSVTICKLQEDNYWQVLNEVHDKVLYEDETEWVDEKIEAMAMDKNCQEAIKTAMGSTLNYLLDNVYKNGFSGLVEFREYERRLNASKVESPQNS